MNSPTDFPLNSQILIRPMMKQDLDSVVRIEELSFEHPWSRQQFMDEIRRGTVSQCLVALVRDAQDKRSSFPCAFPAEKVAGFIMAWLVADELYITNLAVDPERRRCGIASALLSKTLCNAVQEGAMWCQLEVRVSNLPAKDLYARFGFRTLGIRKGYYYNGEDAMVMGKDLVSGSGNCFFGDSAFEVPEPEPETS